MIREVTSTHIETTDLGSFFGSTGLTLLDVDCGDIFVAMQVGVELSWGGRVATVVARDLAEKTVELRFAATFYEASPDGAMWLCEDDMRGRIMKRRVDRTEGNEACAKGPG